MSTRRSSVGVAILNGYLYAVGGYDGVARQCLNSVERYDPVSDEWSIVEPMNQRRSGAAVAVLENFLYAIGGHDGPDIRKSVERYAAFFYYKFLPHLQYNVHTGTCTCTCI